MSDRLQLRLLRRVTALEDLTSAKDLVDQAFRAKNGAPDLDISIFLVDVAQVAQAVAEFMASFMNPPKLDERSASLDGLHATDPEPSDGETRFAFTRSTHHTLKLLSEGELLDLVERLFAERPKRIRATSVDEVRDYVRARLDAKDPEWAACCNERTKWTRFASRQLSLVAKG